MYDIVQTLFTIISFNNKKNIKKKIDIITISQLSEQEMWSKNFQIQAENILSDLLSSKDIENIINKWNLFLTIYDKEDIRDQYIEEVANEHLISNIITIRELIRNEGSWSAVVMMKWDPYGDNFHYWDASVVNLYFSNSTYPYLEKYSYKLDYNKYTEFPIKFNSDPEIIKLRRLFKLDKLKNS